MSPATEALREHLMNGGDHEDLRSVIEAIAMEEATALDVFARASSDLQRCGRDPRLAGATLVETMDRAIEIAANWVDEVHGGAALSAKRREGFELVTALVEMKIDGGQFLIELLRAKRGGLARTIYREERHGQANRASNDNDDDQRLIDAVSARESISPLQLMIAREAHAALMSALNTLPWKLRLVLTVLGGVAQSRAVFRSDEPLDDDAVGGSAAVEDWLTATIAVPDAEADLIAARYLENYRDIRLRQKNPQVRAGGGAIAARDLALLLGVTRGRVTQMAKEAMERIGSQMAS